MVSPLIKATRWLIGGALVAIGTACLVAIALIALMLTAFLFINW